MNEYSDKQRRRDAQYAEAWKQLTPEQREEYARLGIKGPELPRYETNKRLPDISELHDAADEGNCAEAFYAPEHAEHAPATASAFEMGELLKLAIHEIVESEHPSLDAQCVSLAFGFGAAKGYTISVVASQFGQTRAAVSKRVKDIQKHLNLKPSAYMKSEKSCRSYARYNGHI